MTESEPLADLNEVAARHVKALRFRQRGILKVIEKPNTPGRWFLRRIFLEGKLDQFNALRRVMVDTKEARSWGASFWPAAKFYGFEGSDYEKKRIKKLEKDARKCFHLEAHLIKLTEDARRKIMTESLKREDQGYYDDVRWAYSNWSRFLHRKDGSWVQTDEDTLMSEAPSHGAYGLILYAQDQMKEFQALAARVLAKAEVPDGKTEEELKKVDTGIDELRRVVDSL